MSTGGAQVLVVGAGVGGLGSALALSRAGHAVTLVERDATPLPPDPDAAFDWDRRGAPQVRHSHALLARLRNLLRDRYPDVLEALLAAGATEMRFADNLPVDITDRAPRPGDDDLVALACRRTTLEWVLRRTVLADPGVTLLHGCAVERLVARSSATGTPVVEGAVVQPVDGPERTLAADLVVGAVGRRSAVPRWLAQVGVEVGGRSEDTGIVYLSRFYRLLDGADAPPADGPIGGDLGYLKYAVFLGDNRTFSVTLAVNTGDDELRALLLRPVGFDRAARALVATAPWVDADRAEAITPVHVMGGLLNRHLDFLAGDGRPVVLGFHAVGDAHTCTNPLYGRGCSLAMVQATLVADALADHADDPAARAVAFETASEAEIRPWYRAAVAQDRANRRQAEAAATTDAAPDDVTDEFMGELLRHGLMPAVRTDATVFRAFVRAFNLLDPPDALVSDPDVVARVLSAYQERDERPPEPPLGPPRPELVATVGRA